MMIPCALGELRWGMTEDQLRQLRPRIRWSSSDRSFHEDIVGCGPFIDHARYDVHRTGGLGHIHLSRNMTLSSAAELESLIPGFLHGTHVMWGKPQEMEAFRSPTGDATEYWHIGMSWNRPWGRVRASYSSPDALFPSGDYWLASLNVYISPPIYCPPPPWTHGLPDPEILKRYSRPFPTKEVAPDEFLR